MIPLALSPTFIIYTFELYIVIKKILNKKILFLNMYDGRECNGVIFKIILLGKQLYKHEDITIFNVKQMRNVN